MKLSTTINLYLESVGVFGLACTVKAKTANSTVLFEIRRPELRSPLTLRLPSTDPFAYKEVFIDQQYDFLVEEQPRVIVDAGANIGLTSIYLATKYPRARILAIEPDRSNFELLQRNVASYESIEPVHAALWNQDEEIQVIDIGLGHWGFMTQGNDVSIRKGAVRHSIRGMTVDRLMGDYGLDHIDILKIDIEGAEKEVFSDTSSWIGKIDALIVELHERMKPGCLRSFYNGSNGFPAEWMQGGSVYLSRGRCLKRRSKLFPWQEAPVGGVDDPRAA